MSLCAQILPYGDFMKRLGTAEEVAERLNIKRSRPYEMANAGLLDGIVVRLGRQVRFDMDALEEWIGNGGKSLEHGWRKEATQ